MLCFWYYTRLISFSHRTPCPVLSYLPTPWSRVLLEKLTGFAVVKKFPAFMEPESSLPYSQLPDTCPYPEPAPSSSQCLVGKVTLGTDRRSSCSVCYYAYRDGGTLPHQVAHYHIRWHTTTSGPWTPSVSTQYPSHSVTWTDVAGLVQSTVGVGPCDTT
jgi:hypothetical protein